jgi:tRNA threonylcarbamoyladenosine biosynthesis protein TsaB
MLGRVSVRADKTKRLLLIDTCGETAGVALSSGEQIVVSEDLPRGTASAEIISTVRRLLLRAGWTLQDMDAVGVVRGPGSFTGIRAGLAAAKGLCVAVGLPLVAVSRLEVLAEAASLEQGFAVLDAGRGELYVREVTTGREWLSSTSDFNADYKQVAVAEKHLVERLPGSETILRPLHVGDALSAVLRKLQEAPDDVALIDANYVREPDDIYISSKQVAKSIRVAP